MVMLIGLGLMMAVFFVVMSRGQKKQTRERETFLSNLKKNDKVMTVGGVIGTVVSVKDHTVVLKVDESTNTRMTFLKSSVQKNVSDQDLEALNSQPR